MRKLSFLFFCLFIVIAVSSCSEEPIECPDIQGLPGELEVNGENLLLYQSTLSKNEGTIDTYEFLFGGVKKDCITKYRFRFYATMPKNQKLEGDFEVLMTNVYTINKVTSFEFHKTEFFDLESGHVKITNLGVNKYLIKITGKSTKNEKFELELNHQFN